MIFIFVMLFSLFSTQSCMSASDVTTFNVGGLNIKVDDAVRVATETAKVLDEMSRETQMAFERKRATLEQEKLVLVKKKEQGAVGELEYQARLENINSRMKKLESDIVRAEKNGDAWNNNIQEALKGGWQMILAKQQEEAVRKTQVATAVATQAVKNDGALERLKLYFEPQNMVRTGVLLSAVSAGIFASYYGFGVGFRYVESLIGVPSLVQETSVVSLTERIKRRFGFSAFSAEHQFTLDDVILAPELKEKITQLAEHTKKTYEWGIPHRHWLLYGFPGTGKTMIARIVARKSGMDYILVKGGGLLQYSEQVAVQKLHEIFDWAERSPNGVIVVFDEADSFLPEREKLGQSESDAKKYALICAFLSRTNSSSEKCKIILASNHPELDSAVLSRIDEQLEIPLPGAGQRELMLNLYLDKYIKKGTFKIKINGQSKEQIMTLSSEVDQAFVKSIAGKIDGFSGRDIEKMVAAFKNAIISSGKFVATADVFMKVVNDSVAQHKKCAEWGQN